MQRFSIIGTAHLDNAELLQAVERALERLKPDQLILEIPDEAVVRGDLAHQKPEMVCAYNWARVRGTPIRGHEPAEPSILRRELSPERIDALLQTMRRLIQSLSVRSTIDLFSARRAPLTDIERQLASVIDELIDPEQAAARTRGVIEGIRRVAAADGKILVLCGGAHTGEVANALPGASIIHGDYFF